MADLTGRALAGWGEPLPGPGRFSRIGTAFPRRRPRQMATSPRTAGDLRAAANSGMVLQSLRARVAELADAPDLGSGSARSGGSSPLARTSSELTGPHGSGPTAVPPRSWGQHRCLLRDPPSHGPSSMGPPPRRYASASRVMGCTTRIGRPALRTPWINCSRQPVLALATTSAPVARIC